MTELRCEHKLHGILVEPEVLEVKCRSALCGGPGVVVLHRFDTRDGRLIETKRFRDTPSLVTEKDVIDDGHGSGVAIRA